MQKAIIISVFLLLGTGPCFAQQRIIDSIEKLLPSQSDTSLAKSYNELTWQYRTIDQKKRLNMATKPLNWVINWAL